MDMSTYDSETKKEFALIQNLFSVAFIYVQGV